MTYYEEAAVPTPRATSGSSERRGMAAVTMHDIYPEVTETDEIPLPTTACGSPIFVNPLIFNGSLKKGRGGGAGRGAGFSSGRRSSGRSSSGGGDNNSSRSQENRLQQYFRSPSPMRSGRGGAGAVPLPSTPLPPTPPLEDYCARIFAAVGLGPDHADGARRRFLLSLGGPRAGPVADTDTDTDAELLAAESHAASLEAEVDALKAHVRVS